MKARGKGASTARYNCPSFPPFLPLLLPPPLPSLLLVAAAAAVYQERAQLAYQEMTRGYQKLK